MIKEALEHKRIDVTVHSSFEDLSNIQAEWDQFVEVVGSDIFLTYDWCKTWWKYYGKGRDLKVFIFRDSKNLIGIIPLFFEKLWLGPIFVRVGKVVGSDFTLSQFSLPLAVDYISAVTEKFSELLSKEKWDIVHIGPLAGLYEHSDKLMCEFNRCADDSHSVLLKNRNVQTYYKLVENGKDHLASFRKKGRRDIKRSYNLLNMMFQRKDGNLVSYHATEQDLNEIFEGFVQTHQQYWQGLGKAGHFGDWPDSFDFHREVAESQLKHDRLRLMASKWGDCNLGYEYAYKFGGKYFAILNSRLGSKELTKIGLGKVLFGEQVKYALGENVRYIDSMQGKYSYKLHLGGKLFEIKSLYLIPKKRIVRARVLLFRLFSRILNLLYWKIWYCRISPKLGVNPGPLWRIWIRSNGLI